MCFMRQMVRHCGILLIAVPVMLLKACQDEITSRGLLDTPKRVFRIFLGWGQFVIIRMK